MSSLQTLNAIAGMGIAETDKLKAVKVYNKTSYDRIAAANTYGIPVKTYAQYRSALNQISDDSSYSQDEAKQALGQTDGLTNDQKAVLYALTNKGWKTNPYRYGFTFHSINYDWPDE